MRQSREQQALANAQMPEEHLTTLRLCRHLRNIRKERNWSARYVVELIGDKILNASTLRRYETGMFIPPFNVMWKWCRTLGVPISINCKLPELEDDI